MKRFQIYRNGAFDEDSLVILDFTTVPEDALQVAEQEAFDLSFSRAVGEGETIEDVYQGFSQLCGFEPWIWKPGGGWNPQGLSREGLMLGQKLAAKAELKEYLRTFVDTSPPGRQPGRHTRNFRPGPRRYRGSVSRRMSKTWSPFAFPLGTSARGIFLVDL